MKALNGFLVTLKVYNV